MMKMFRTLLVCCVLGMGLQACTPQGRADAKAAIDALTVACIFAHADLPIQQVQTACSVESALAPDVKTIIDSFKAQRAAYAAEQLKQSNCTK